jgi:hypothetical protein
VSSADVSGLKDYLARWRAAAPEASMLEPTARQAVRAGGQAAAAARKSANVQYTVTGRSLRITATGPGARAALAGARAQLAGAGAQLRDAVARKVGR